MNQFAFTKLVEFHSGIIGLTEKQVSVRHGQLKELKKGRYEVVATVQIKAGEKVGLEEVPKVYQHLLTPEAEKILAQVDKPAAEKILAQVDKPAAEKKIRAKA